MAFLLEDGSLAGSLKNLSFYKDKNTGKIIVRTKGGASRQRIKKDPTFKRTRENNMEFGGCSATVKEIRNSMHFLTRLSDYNFTSKLQSIANDIKKMDNKGNRGERCIYVSRGRYLLEGFQLNKKHPLDSVIRHPLRCSIDRSSNTAQIILPTLHPETNLFIPWKASLYRLRFTLGVVHDTIFNGKDYTSKIKTIYPVDAHTEWYSIQQNLPEQIITLKHDCGELIENSSLILAGGIEMGAPLSDHMIEAVKHQGAAKILATA